MESAIRAESFAIPTSAGSLAGWFATPRATGAHPVILVAHSSAGVEEETYAWARHFAERGFAAVVVIRRDYPVTGGRPPIKIRWGPLAIEDCRAVLARLRHIPGADAGRVGWFGFSEGASLGYRLAAHLPQLKAVAGWGGVGETADFFRWVIERWKHYPHEWMREYAAFIGRRYAGRDRVVSSRVARDFAPDFATRIAARVLLLHGEEDLWVPIRQAERFMRALRRLGKHVAVRIYPTEGHLLYVFTRPDSDWGDDATSAWLRPQFVTTFTAAQVKEELVRFFRDTLQA
jgi:dienelactone hydrolase